MTNDRNMEVYVDSTIPLKEHKYQGFNQNTNITVRLEAIDDKGKKIILSREEAEVAIVSATRVVKGANLYRNEYGNPLFADFFFFITGFHGFHVFSGVIINIIIFINVLLGDRKSVV